jgi:hypothetical protein
VELLSFIFRVPSPEIVVQSGGQVNQSYLIVRELADRHYVLNAGAESLVKAGHSGPFVPRHLCCKPGELG